MEREPFGLLVPAYVYPGPGDWDVLLAVGRKLQKGLITVASRPDNPPNQERYSKPHVIEKKKSAQAASNASS